MSYRVYGYSVVEREIMVVDGESYKVLRTWKERLLSRPWRPFVKTRTVVPKIPDPNFLIDEHNGIIYGHPQTVRALKEATFQASQYA